MVYWLLIAQCIDANKNRLRGFPLHHIPFLFTFAGMFYRRNIGFMTHFRWLKKWSAGFMVVMMLLATVHPACAQILTGNNAGITATQKTDAAAQKSKKDAKKEERAKKKKERLEKKKKAKKERKKKKEEKHRKKVDKRLKKEERKKAKKEARAERKRAKKHQDANPEPPKADTVITPAGDTVIKYSLNPSTHKASYRIDVLLPLYLDEEATGGGTLSARAKDGIAFYKGLQLAADTLDKMGVNIALYVHDIASINTFTDSFVKKKV
ncbi:MAG: hypothetical protein EBX41_06865 [Chitinophagia bacterium]|nr:hypothetical protein [Chitinophagia bacterium]